MTTNKQNYETVENPDFTDSFRKKQNKEDLLMKLEGVCYSMAEQFQQMATEECESQIPNMNLIYDLISEQRRIIQIPRKLKNRYSL